MRATVRNREKFIKTPSFGCSRSFKVIHVDKTEKPDYCLLW